MSVRSVFERTARWMVSTPLLWLYGVLAAFLGWSNLPVTLISTGMRAPDEMLGRGAAGVLLLAVCMLIALLLEIATIRALASASIAASLARLPKTIGFFIAMGIATLVIAISVVFSLTWILSTVAGAIINFVTLDLASLIALLLMSLSLVLPLWALTPLGERAAVLSDGGVWDAVFASLALFEEGLGAPLLALVVTLVLDLVVFAAGSVLDARDLSAPALLGIVAEWQGANVFAGITVFIASAFVGAFKLALWTAIYVEVAPRIKGELAITQSGQPHPVSARRWLTAVAAHSRRALQALVRAPLLVILAALIAFVGVPGPADLLTLYRLIPTPEQSPNVRVFLGLFSGGQVLLLILAPAALIASTMLSAMLIAASREALRGQDAGLIESVSQGFARWWVLLLTKGALAVMAGILGLIVMVGGLFALGMLVAIVPGFNPLGDYWTTIAVLLTILFALLLLPVVARVVMFEEVRYGDAVMRAIDILFERPLLALCLFVLTFGLDVLKGPIATLFGLLTNGWADLLALLVGRSVAQPIGLVTWVASVALYVFATVSIAFKALVWTEFYEHAAARAETEASSSELKEAVVEAKAPKARAGRKRAAPPA